MSRTSAPVSGLLLVDKPEGPTSRRIVDRVVSVLGTRRVGHAGTLDPMASGLLILVWEGATPLVPYLQDYDKQYDAHVRFGRVTDTQDRTGVVLEERDASALLDEAVHHALPAFRGLIQQAPPAFSALKVGGRRRYDLARLGSTEPAPERPRFVSRFDLVEWRPPVGRFVVECQGGTYVRALAHDLGRAVGTGACLDDLRRTRIGPFHVEAAVSANDLEGMTRSELLARAHAPAAALPDWPAVHLTREEARRIRVGHWADERSQTVLPRGHRLLDETGNLLALVHGGVPPRILRVTAGPDAAR